MTISDRGAVGSGQTYVVAEVDGRKATTLDDFSAPFVGLLVRRGAESCRIVGVGAPPQADGVRFHQKDDGPDGKDVRVWMITDRGDGTFCAEALAMY